MISIFLNMLRIEREEKHFKCFTSVIILIVPNKTGAQWLPIEEASKKECCLVCLVFLIAILVS